MNNEHKTPETIGIRFETNRIQFDRRYRQGLWGVFDYKKKDYIATGPKGDMNTLAKLMQQYGT